MRGTEPFFLSTTENTKPLFRHHFFSILKPNGFKFGAIDNCLKWMVLRGICDFLPFKKCKIEIEGRLRISFSSYLVYLLSGFFFFKMSVLKISTEIQTT